MFFQKQGLFQCPPKGGEAVCLLAEKLINKVLLYINKTFKRTLKKRTNRSSPLQGEIEWVGNILPHG